MVAEKGRGATLNVASHRFNIAEQIADGDWLDTLDAIDGPAPRRRTQVTVEHPRTIISRNKSPDLSFSQSINAYRGCDQPSNSCVMSCRGILDNSFWEAERHTATQLGMGDIVERQFYMLNLWRRASWPRQRLGLQAA